MEKTVDKLRPVSAVWPGILAGPFIPAVLFAAAFALRSYRIAENLLWFDELYGYLLGENGLAAILQNSLKDPHPPLFYLLQWAASGFGAWQSEWAVRWLSVLSGSLTVALIYVLARRFTGLVPALLSAGVLLISPTHLYYSQEGRSFAFVVLLVCLSTWVLLKLDENPNQARLWILLAVVTLAGLYTSYAYLLVAGVQALYLVWKHFRNANLWVCLGVVLAACIPLIPLLFRSLARTNLLTPISQPLTLVRTLLGIFGGEPIRYGFGPSHLWLPLGIGMLAAVGGASLFAARRRQAGGVYLISQAAIPLVLFFGIASPLLGLRLPAHESKQFLVLLPALHLLLAAGAGMQWEFRWGFPRRLAQRAVLVVLAVMMLGASLPGIQTYWSVQKSPEALLILAVRDRLEPGDAVITLYHSLDAAASFYLDDETTVYYNPQVSVPAVSFPDSPQFVPGAEDAHWSSLEETRAHPRLWLLTHDTTPAPVIHEISAGCTVDGPYDYQPFHLYLLTGCSP